MKEEIANLAKAKERAWIGRAYTDGGHRSVVEHRKFLSRNKNRKEYK
jgi:hypothetical protein